jgi:hypothetical protein
MNPLARSLYRIRQFRVSIRPSVDETLKETAFGTLGEGERALFESMTVRDQQHCLDVYRALRGQGHADRDLLAAALLHDCGKGQIATWHRVAYVLLDLAPPSTLDRIAQSGEGHGWRQALYRCRHHPDLGADLAKQAGSSDLTVALIRGDALSEASRGHLSALEAADDTA